MAFPATYDFNYYKGDTFEFRIYPKKNDGTVFDLSAFYVPTNFASLPDDVELDSLPAHAPYDSAQFTIANARGSAATEVRKGFARVSYDVEVRKPAGLPGSGQYEIIQTLLTGTITVTDQVTGATPATQPGA
jgi:hypothetical protein